VRRLLVPIAEHMFILMDLYDKLFTQFSSNLSKHIATGHLQHPVRHVLNVWSTDLHVGSKTVATAANPARMMNRALKQQATELGPNMWQQQQGIAKYDKIVPYFCIPSSPPQYLGQQHYWLHHLSYQNVQIVLALLISCGC
jgi:hypothetical protein